MRSTGILNKIDKEIFEISPKFSVIEFRKTDKLNAVELQQIGWILLILGVGFILSAIILLCEIFVLTQQTVKKCRWVLD